MFLGLDLSTQQLKGVVIDGHLTLRSETSVAFDKDLPHYGTQKGVFVKGKQVLSPVAMWIEALDLLCSRMKADGVPLNRIQAISGSGQQHGSIYWSTSASDILGNLDGERSLADQLGQDALAYELSPNWQDASTQTECDEIEACVGGAAELAGITGSKAHHRFTGPQILRLRKHAPEVYAQTAQISLVSSFLCSLLLGKIAPIDPSDVCGGNFWDIKKEKFDDAILACIGGTTDTTSLKNKLGDVCMNGAELLGPISPYFQIKYGFSETCRIAPFTGDNPATILALPLEERTAILSLGTSTTMLLSTGEYIPDPAYHVFAHPITKGQHMVMLCYKNGSLAREQVRNAINEKYKLEQDDWTKFNDLSCIVPSAHAVTPSRLGLYYTLPEIIPPSEAGTWRFLANDNDTIDPALIHPDTPKSDASSWQIPEDDARAILESQFLDIRMRSHTFFTPRPHLALSSTSSSSSTTKQSISTPISSQGASSTGHPPPASSPSSSYTDPENRATRIYVVGGSSRNPSILSAVTNVLGAREGVFRQTQGSSNACALGGANKAAYAHFVSGRSMYSAKERDTTGPRTPARDRDPSQDCDRVNDPGATPEDRVPREEEVSSRAKAENGTGSDAPVTISFEDFVTQFWNESATIQRIDNVDAQCSHTYTHAQEYNRPDGYDGSEKGTGTETGTDTGLETWAAYGARIPALRRAEEMVVNGLV